MYNQKRMWQKYHIFLLFIKQGSTRCGLDKEMLHLFRVLFFKTIPEMRDCRDELIGFIEQDVFVQKEQLGPHILIDGSNSGQIAETVTGVFHQMGIVMGIHQTDGNHMGQL